MSEIVDLVQDITMHKRGEEALHLSTKRLEILHEIDQAILEVRSPEVIAQIALERICTLLPCFSAVIGIADFETHKPVLLAVYPQEGSALQAGMDVSSDMFGAIINVLRRGDVFQTLTLADLPDHPAVRELIAAGLKSCAIMPLAFQGKLIGAFCLLANRPDGLTAEQIEIAREIADTLAVAIQNARLFGFINEQSHRLLGQSARLEQFEVAERQKLARELHDRVGQNLSALHLNLSIIKSLVTPELKGTIGGRLDDSLNLLAETVEQTQDVMSELRPPVLDQYGLFAALRWYAEGFTKRTEIGVALHGGEQSPRLPFNVENALFRISQEALTNIAKHAKANRVTLTLDDNPERVELSIADNGIGFDLSSVHATEGRIKWGLVTMRERAEMIGAHWEITSTPGQGTRITVQVARR
jgi:signal transduction histidine kinase